MVIELTRDNFDSVIEDNAMTLVDFWAPWCGPCRSFAQIYDEIAQRHPGIVFGKINIEQEEQLKVDFNIKHIPHLMIFRSNIAVFSESGVLTGSALEELIAKAEALDLAELQSEIAKHQQGGNDTQ